MSDPETDLDDVLPDVPLPPTRLVWPDALRAGHIVVGEQACPSSPLLEALTGRAHSHSRLYWTVTEVREAGGLYAAILLDEHGEQQTLHWHQLEPVRVLTDD